VNLPLQTSILLQFIKWSCPQIDLVNDQL
jgi:hypothetical protein